MTADIDRITLGTATLHVVTDSYPVTIVELSTSRKTATVLRKTGELQKFRWNQRYGQRGRYVSGRPDSRGVYAYTLSLDAGIDYRDPSF